MTEGGDRFPAQPVFDHAPDELAGERQFEGDVRERDTPGNSAALT
jgi:hypothetical protein